MQRIGLLILMTTGTIACGSVSSSHEAGDDSAGDAGTGGAGPPDAPVCYGHAAFNLCFPSAPTNSLMILSDTIIETSTSSMCSPIQTAVAGCIVVAKDILIAAKLRGTGAKPLVLVASDTITVSEHGFIDVGSHRDMSPELGAGADPASCLPPVPPDTIGGGGGAGGSFVGKGGDGGEGGAGEGGKASPATSDLDVLRGGCPGQTASGAEPGMGGHGGGAVQLIAGTTLNLMGPVIATGEGGGGGRDCASLKQSGGGGGGAGGMIGFDALTVTSTGLILASGGAGGSGCIESSLGIPGMDPSTVAPAQGPINTYNTGEGIGESSSGGNGSSAILAGPGAVGMNAAIGGSGGGGGGGAAGQIRSPSTAMLGNTLSPPSTPW
jgi:hypothetical protein